MIYSILASGAFLPAINLFKYITFRSIMALLTSFLVSVLVTPKVIRLLRELYPKGQPIRHSGPEKHIIDKKGTPTMGGLIIIGSMLISVFLWTNLMNPYIWITIFVTVSFSLLGFTDDYLKVSRGNHSGIRGKAKLVVQALVSVVACFAVQKYSTPQYLSHVTIPFFKNIVIDLGYFYVVFVMFVIVGASNAVNLTDGLDGLATVPIVIVAMCFAIICYLVGNYVFANYLQLHYVPGVGELTVLCAANIL